MKDSGLSA
jgi:hypothetical protein